MSDNGITKLLQSNQRQSPEESFQPNALFASGTTQIHTNPVDAHEQERKRAFDQGYQDAVKRVQEEWQEKLTLIEAISQVLNHPVEQIDKLIQDKTAELAIAIAKQIVRRELSIDSGQIVSAVKQAIDLIPKDGEKINLHINPRDIQYVNDIFSDEYSADKYNIIQDPSIDVGGCKALTDYSLVDLSVEKQIAGIAAQIFGDQRSATE